MAHFGAAGGGLRLALLGSVALIAAAGQANAQAQTETLPQGEDTSLASERDRDSEIVVTGSRLRGSTPVGSSLIGVTRDDIEMSSSTTTFQVMQELPQVLNLGVSDSSRGQSGGAANTSFSSAINIRGLGPYSTLTLIDGHRSVLVRASRLGELTRSQLAEVVEDAWLSQASRRRGEQWLASRA